MGKMTELYKNRYWGVAKGRQTGIFTTWTGSHEQVNAFSGACHAGFPNLQECVSFLLANGDFESTDDVHVHTEQGNLSLSTYQKTLDETQNQKSMPDTLSTAISYICI